jgi:hypothetical protein
LTTFKVYDISLINNFLSKKMSKEIIGGFGVDSGQVLIIDPCYLDKWKHGNFEFEKTDGVFNDYDEACRITLDAKLGGNHSRGGVVLSTGWGDGFYNVKVKREEGRIKSLTIKFF